MKSMLEHLTDKERSDYFLAVLKSVVEGIIVIDIKGCIQGCNRVIKDVFGYSPEEIRGKNVRMLMPEPYRSAHDSYLNHYLETGQKKIIGMGREVTGQHKNGHTFAMHLAVSEVKDGLHHHFIGIVRDISNRKMIESQLLKAKSDAQAASEAKSGFLANMSHELRTPMNAIIGFAGILGEGMAGELNDEQKKQVAIIQSSGEHLLELINNILDISKIEAGKMQLELEACSLTRLIDEAMDIVSPLAESKGLKLGKQIQCASDELLQDAGKLKQVLLNLLSNAVKFTPAGTVEVHVHQEKNVLSIQVIDSGMGIAAQHHGTVFDAFEQVGAKTGTGTGTGLGLSLCRKILALMGGDISVKSELGKGSVFSFTVPARLKSGQEFHLEPTHIHLPESIDPKRPLVLIADDDPDAQELLRHYFSKAGFQIIQVFRGEDVAPVVKEYMPDLVSLDIVLPDKNGWEVLTALKCDQVTMPVPVICISMLDDRLTALSMGAVAFLAKPVDYETLMDVVKPLVSKKI